MSHPDIHGGVYAICADCGKHVAGGEAMWRCSGAGCRTFVCSPGCFYDHVAEEHRLRQVTGDLIIVGDPDAFPEDSGARSDDTKSAGGSSEPEGGGR